MKITESNMTDSLEQQLLTHLSVPDDNPQPLPAVYVTWLCEQLDDARPDHTVEVMCEH